MKKQQKTACLMKKQLKTALQLDAARGGRHDWEAAEAEAQLGQLLQEPRQPGTHFLQVRNLMMKHPQFEFESCSLLQRVPLPADDPDQAAVRVQDRLLHARPGRKRVDR